MSLPIMLILPYAPCANKSWKPVRGQLKLSPKVRAYRDEVAIMNRHIKPLDGEVEVTLNVYRPQKSGDLDGRIKQTLDALNGIAYHDDKQIVRIVASRYDDKTNPRIEVCVSEVCISPAINNPPVVAERVSP